MLGKRPETLRFAMLILLALTIVVGLQTVGVGLVAAMLVTPAATAYLLTRRLATMMAVSAVIGAASSVAGLYASYYLDVASGAAVVLIATAAFLARLRVRAAARARRPPRRAARRLTPAGPRHSPDSPRGYASGTFGASTVSRKTPSGATQHPSVSRTPAVCNSPCRKPHEEGHHADNARPGL